MSERKGRAAAKGAVQGARCYLALVLVQAFLRTAFGITVPWLAVVTEALITMTFLTLGVVIAWNLYACLAGDTAKRRAVRAEDLPARYRGPAARERGLLVTGIDERRQPVHFPVYGSSAAAVHRAVLHGKLSVNGYRYLGPPPVALVTGVTYEVRDGVRLIREMSVAEQRMLPSGGRHSSVCDGCGAHLVYCSFPFGTPHAHICEECVRP